MTAPERDWREAKIPQWVKDGIDAELAQYRLTVALSWPTEAKPEPLPFRWGEYDRLIGDASPGHYWAVPHYERVVGFDLARVADLPKPVSKPWAIWAFKGRSYGWTGEVERGPLFASERDANLYALWLACEDCAAKLAKLRSRI